jgi:uncharacterized protein YdeI (YjbR/CyaY-like superfamily)
VDLPTIAFATQDEWREWLHANHDSAPGVWMKRAKKASGLPSLDWAEAVEVALCYGWIDGQAKALDERWYLQRFTPRRPRSLWSKVNVEKANALIASGRMQPAGMREVERAKADGRWDAAYAPPSANHVPDELQRELDADPAVAEAWEKLDRQNRYAMQHRVATAKKPETRVRRAEKFAAMLLAGEKIHS